MPIRAMPELCRRRSDRVATEADQIAPRSSGPKIAVLPIIDRDINDAEGRVYQFGTEGQILCPKEASNAGGSDGQQQSENCGPAAERR
jgi:hypothetical protein